jgi:hypothetical protein
MCVCVNLSRPASPRTPRSYPHGLQVPHQHGHLRALGGLGDEVEVPQERRGGVCAGRRRRRRGVGGLCLGWWLLLGLGFGERGGRAGCGGGELGVHGEEEVEEDGEGDGVRRQDDAVRLCVCSCLRWGGWAEVPSRSVPEGEVDDSEGES